MKSGVYNPWTDRCSDADAPVRREIYIRQPAGDGQFPVLLFFIGTLRSPHNPTARSIVDRAAELGFVAASVDYDTIASDFHAVGECDSIRAKARCTLTVDDPASAESALQLICSNRRIDGSDAGLKADCDQGIVVSGFSQGATMAMIARDYEPRIAAMWGVGFHDQGLLDKKPLSCVHGSDGRPPGPRSLPTSRMRLIVGEQDKMMRRPLRPHLEDVTGRVCTPAAGQCFAEDGSGWGLVPNRECTGNCVHEFLDDSHFWESPRWWGADANLAWLTRFVEAPPAPVATTADTCREESVAAIRRILVEKRPSIWQCDDKAEHLEVVEIVAADGDTQSRRVIERALSTWRPPAAIERIEHSVAVVTLSDDRLLGEAMGSTGAYCYLASLTVTLTSLPGIDAVWLEIEEGSHAGPGLYSRSSFLEMFELGGLP